jgi:hypothetical protein
MAFKIYMNNDEIPSDVLRYFIFVAQRESATIPFSEDFYMRKSVRYGKDGTKIYPSSGLQIQVQF